MIKEWIESYEPKNIQDTEQALREIMQEIALAGLYRANFFKHAAFYGGTALRIFHGLNRFSEDLDFSLLQKDADFEFDHYFKSIVDEFQALGIKVSLNQKMKSTISTIDSAFLKSDTLWSELIFEDTIPQIKLSIKPSIKIKLEIFFFWFCGFLFWVFLGGGGGLNRVPAQPSCFPVFYLNNPNQF